MRMAHLHHGMPNVLKEIVTGLPKFRVKQHEVCKGYASGKYSKTNFSSRDARPKGILDLIHLDVCGLMSVAFLSRYHYFVTFINDFFRKTWIYFVKKKYEVFSSLKEFKTLVENQTKRKIKTLRSDNGDEYTLFPSRNFVHMRASDGANSSLQPSTKWGCKTKE